MVSCQRNILCMSKGGLGRTRLCGGDVTLTTERHHIARVIEPHSRTFRCSVTPFLNTTSFALQVRTELPAPRKSPHRSFLDQMLDVHSTTSDTGPSSQHARYSDTNSETHLSFKTLSLLLSIQSLIKLAHASSTSSAPQHTRLKLCLLLQALCALGSLRCTLSGNRRRQGTQTSVRSHSGCGRGLCPSQIAQTLRFVDQLALLTGFLGCVDGGIGLVFKAQ